METNANTITTMGLLSQLAYLKFGEEPIVKGNLPAYNDINPDDYSPAFMTDRANYLYYILNEESRYVTAAVKTATEHLTVTVKALPATIWS